MNKLHSLKPSKYTNILVYVHVRAKSGKTAVVYMCVRDIIMYMCIYIWIATIGLGNLCLRWSCTLNLISTFSFLSRGRYLCWWTICPQGYHPPSRQCFGTGMAYLLSQEKQRSCICVLGISSCICVYIYG
jgi:hypothetical protein